MTSFRIAVASLVLVFVAHWHVHVGYLRHLNTATVLERELPAAASHAPIPPARRLFVVVLDGLGFDDGMALPPIAVLGSAGVSRVLLADFPSFTYGSITSMATGRPPRYSGVRINSPRPLLPWDSISRSASRGGLGVRVSGNYFGNLTKLLLLPADATLPAIDEMLAPAPPDRRELGWLYFGEVDHQSHLHGRLGPEFAVAARDAGAFVERTHAAIDLRRDAIVVVSDHGHVPAGGHGGSEPEALRALFVAAGPGFPHGVRLPPAPMEDLAPTIAAALGIEPPKNALGKPMLDAFGLAPPAEGRAAEVRADYDRYFAEFKRAASGRLALAALFLAAIAGYALRRVPLRPRDFLPVAVFSIVFAIGYWLSGFAVTWSVPRSQPAYQAQTALVCAFGIALAWAVSHKTRLTEETLAIALVLGGAYVLCTAWLGFDARWIAGPWASFLFLVIVTMLFYALLVFALRTLHSTGKMTIAKTAVLTAASLVLFLAPFILRFKLPR